MCNSSDLLCVQRLDKLVDLEWVLPGGWTAGKKTAEEMRAEERNLKAQKLQIAKDNQTGLLGFFSGVSNSALTAQLLLSKSWSQLNCRMTNSERWSVSNDTMN